MSFTSPVSLVISFLLPALPLRRVFLNSIEEYPRKLAALRRDDKYRIGYEKFFRESLVPTPDDLVRLRYFSFKQIHLEASDREEKRSLNRSDRKLHPLKITSRLAFTPIGVRCSITRVQNKCSKLAYSGGRRVEYPG